MTELVHTVALNLESHDNYSERIMCVCGNVYVSFDGPPYETALEQMSKHLREFNRQPSNELTLPSHFAHQVTERDLRIAMVRVAIVTVLVCVVAYLLMAGGS